MSAFTKDISSFMLTLSVAIMFLSFACYAQNQQVINASPDVYYLMNGTNSKENPTTHVFTSTIYQYDSIFGYPMQISFVNAEVYFEYQKLDADFGFEVSVVSKEVDYIEKTEFGTLELSIPTAVSGKIVLRFNAPSGILNIDLLRHMRADFINSNVVTQELTPTGNRFGTIRRYCDKFEVELDLDIITKTMGMNTFEVSLWTNDSPNDPTPLVDFRWIEVPYPASFMMKLESDPSISRYFGIGFPGQQPVNYLATIPPKFRISELNTIQMKDIKDDRLKSGEYTVMMSYYFQTDRLELTGSFMQYNYNYNDLKDIYGNDVEIKFDEVYCGTSNGVAYTAGVPIYPVNALYEQYGSVTCPEAVMVPNSVIIIYAKVVMIKRPQVDMLTQNEKVKGDVSNGFGKYMRSGLIEKDTCIVFKGDVTKSDLSIYMLQQKQADYLINPTVKYFTEVQTLQVGSNREAKFCSTKKSFENIGSFEQEMAFVLISPNMSMVSGFNLVANVGDQSNTAGIVVGVLFTIGIVGVLVVASIIGGILYWRKRKSYETIN